MENVPFLCNLCFPEGKDYGAITETLHLVENEGRYAIMTSPGHKDDEILIFPQKPTPDPDPNYLQDRGDLFEQAVAWTDLVIDWSDSTKVSVVEGYIIYKEAEEAGWTTGDVLMWYFDQAGKRIKEIDNA